MSRATPFTAQDDDSGDDGMSFMDFLKTEKPPGPSPGREQHPLSSSVGSSPAPAPASPKPRSSSDAPTPLSILKSEGSFKKKASSIGKLFKHLRDGSNDEDQGDGESEDLNTSSPPPPQLDPELEKEKERASLERLTKVGVL